MLSPDRDSKGYITDLPGASAEFAIGYHRLFEIERSFLMSKHDLAAPADLPLYKRASIEAHLTIVFAALAVSRLVEDRTSWSIRKFVQTIRRYPPSRSALALNC